MTNSKNKICILSPGRAGTKTLVRSLQDHPEIKMQHDETFCTDSTFWRSHWPFLSKYNVDFAKMGVHDNTVLNFFEDVDIYEYLDFVYSQEDMTKILYYHYERFPEIRRFLMSRPDILIVHLTRQNLIEVLCSSENIRVANTTGKPIDTYDDWGIGYKTCYNHLCLLLNNERTIDIDFSDRVVKVYFEQMISNWDRNIDRILSQTSFKNSPVEMKYKIDYGTNSTIMPGALYHALVSQGLGWTYLGKRT